MRLVTYEIEHKSGLGVISRDGSWVYPLASLDMDYKTMQELIENISESEKQLLEYVSGQDPYKVRGAAPIGEVSLLAPIPHPRQDVICLGINYMAHAEESARFKKEAFDGERPHAIYFSKRVNRATDPGAGIPSHRDIVTDLDYEAELAVIIGKDARNVREEDALDYIFGYTILNDMSARNLQTRHTQWYFGKSLDGFTPMGPAIVTKDEIMYPPKLKIQTLVNGELRQSSSTDLLIFDIGYVIHELSQGMTLKAGTIISTGTPKGVGMGFTPPRFLHKGDVIECKIEKLGTLVNQID